MASEQIDLTQHRHVSGIGPRRSQRPDRAMKVVLLRVGVDTGCRPIHAHGPLFPDGSFEYVPIPDLSAANERRTYGNTMGRSGRPLVDFFPGRRAAIVDHPMHVDPEFETWTYGLPARIQAHLSTLEEGALLAFYGGLRPIEPSDDAIPPAALYLFGYFDVLGAVRARDYTRDDLLPMFGENFHVRHPELFDAQHDRLVLVTGTP